MKFTRNAIFVASMALLPTLVSATSIKMDFLPSAHVRTDPIITQTCLSDHVHTFYGAQNVRPEVTHDDLVSMPKTQNTGNVLENMSLYWHPSIYSYSPNTDTYTRQDIFYASAYYIWDQRQQVRAFPNGFRMIAGMNPNAPGNFPNVGVGCSGESRCRRNDGGCNVGSTALFPREACTELEISMNFPVCWDGRLDSPDHQSHVAYTINGEHDGPCPSTHQAGRFPKMELFFRISPYIGGSHTFSDGSDIFHADYISGWDENFLQNVINNCKTDSFASNPDSRCENFLTFKDAPKDDGMEEDQLRLKLEQFQPPPLNVKGTVAPEEVDVVVGSLPRGTCNGQLINPVPTTPTISSPTSAPVPGPTSPTSPTFPTSPTSPTSPTNSEEDDSEGDEGLLSWFFNLLFW